MSISKLIDKSIMKSGDAIVESVALVVKLATSAACGVAAGACTAATTTVDLGGKAVREFKERVIDN